MQESGGGVVDKRQEEEERTPPAVLPWAHGTHAHTRMHIHVLQQGSGPGRRGGVSVSVSAHTRICWSHPGNRG